MDLGIFTLYLFPWILLSLGTHSRVISRNRARTIPGCAITENKQLSQWLRIYVIWELHVIEQCCRIPCVLKHWWFKPLLKIFLFRTPRIVCFSKLIGKTTVTKRGTTHTLFTNGCYSVHLNQCSFLKSALVIEHIICHRAASVLPLDRSHVHVLKVTFTQTTNIYWMYAKCMVPWKVLRVQQLTRKTCPFMPS